jgi:hypothetical protein
MDSIPQKICPRCKQTKPLADFRNDRSRIDGLFPWCRECCQAHDRSDRRKEQKRDRQRERYITDPSYQEYKKKRATDHYWSSPEYRAQQIANQAQYQADPANKMRLAMLARVRQASGRYRQRDQDRSKTPHRRLMHRIYTHTRRAQKRGSSGTFTKPEWEALCAACNHRCLCCGQQKPLTPDHIKPLSRGGSNDISNIQPLCWLCNTRKNAKTIDYRPLSQSSLDLDDS